MLGMIHYKKFPFTEFQMKLPCSEKPSRNSCDETNTYNPNLQSHFFNTDFVTWAIPKSTSVWLGKKFKIENKTSLYGTVAYITALLLHIVAIHI